MLGWLTKKATEKSKSNIDEIINNFVLLIPVMEREIAENGGEPLTSGAVHDMLLKQRHDLFFQLSGPMSMDEVRAHVEPFLAKSTTHRLVRVVVEDTIKQYEAST
jgi:hypothetical protein